MARDLLKVRIQLERIMCHDEGDGWGSAEPYLWPVFFKIDGDSVTLTDALQLSGTATVEGTFGSHGNLGNTDVDPGEHMSISEALGTWETNLRPIPVHPSLSGLVEDVAGVAGVAVILMEEDNVTDAGAIAGYQALVAAIKAGLDNLIPTLGFANQDITEADIEAIKAAAEAAVKQAIQDNQGFFENIWAAINPDDQVGSLVAHFSHDLLAEGAVQPIHERWQNEGDWEIFGHAVATVLCPADAVDILKDLLGKIFGAKEMGMMREFRDEQLRDRPGARSWWELAERNGPALMWLFQTDRQAAGALAELGPSAARLLGDLDAPIPDELIRNARTILERASRAPSRRLRVDAKRALSLIEFAPGRSVGQALQVADSVPPGRKVDRAVIDELRAKGPGQAS